MRGHGYGTEANWVKINFTWAATTSEPISTGGCLGHKGLLYNRVITPLISRWVITPVKPMYFWPFIEVITPFISIVGGMSCMGWLHGNMCGSIENIRLKHTEVKWRVFVSFVCLFVCLFVFVCADELIWWLTQTLNVWYIYCTYICLILGQVGDCFDFVCPSWN